MADVAAQFPAKTAGHGGDRLDPKVLADGTKEFDLEAKIVKWEVSPGKLVDAWTYNGVVPAPEIHVNDGDKVRIVLKNSLPESTSLHLHGIQVPNAMDGVDPYTQPPIVPGDSFTYEFVAKGPAVGIYHSHHDAQVQVPNGLFGAFTIGEMPIPQELHRQGLHADRQVDEHGPQRCRNDRLEPQRQELPGHRAGDPRCRAGDGGQLPQRRSDGAPDAPAPAGRMDHRQGRSSSRSPASRRHRSTLLPASATPCCTRPSSRACGRGTATSSTTPKDPPGCSAW